MLITSLKPVSCFIVYILLLNYCYHMNTVNILYSRYNVSVRDVVVPVSPLIRSCGYANNHQGSVKALPDCARCNHAAIRHGFTSLAPAANEPPNLRTDSRCRSRWGSTLYFVPFLPLPCIVLNESISPTMMKVGGFFTFGFGLHCFDQRRVASSPQVRCLPTSSGCDECTQL